MALWRFLYKNQININALLFFSPQKSKFLHHFYTYFMIAGPCA